MIPFEAWRAGGVLRTLALAGPAAAIGGSAGREHGAAVGILAALACGGVLLFRRPPWPALLFIGAYAAVMALAIVDGAIGEGVRGGLRAAGSAALFAIVIGMRGWFRGERPLESFMPAIDLYLNGGIGLIAFLFALGFAREDRWPTVAIAGLFALFLALWWPGSEKVRSRVWIAGATFIAFMAMMKGFSPGGNGIGLRPFLPMIVVAFVARNVPGLRRERVEPASSAAPTA